MIKSISVFLFVFSFQTLAQDLVILHTNDHHGSFAADAEGNFGLAAQATLVKKVRAEAQAKGDEVLLLSAGDINTGPPESNLFKAAPDIEAMNAMGYDAMAVGNHEFDHSLPVLKEQEEMARFKFLSANIKYESGEAVFQSHITKDIGGYKIAIIGLTTPDTPKISLPKNVRGLVFESPFTKTKTLIRSLKQDHDFVIVLSHLGFYPNESHGKDFPGDITLAKEIPEIDLIIGGHTHAELSRPVLEGKTLIVQAKESGQFVGRLDFKLSKKGISLKNYNLIPVKDIAPDPHVASLLRPYLVKAEKTLSTPIARSLSAFDGGRGIIDTSEQPLGNLVAQAQKEASQSDIAIVDSKGLRTGLPAGDINLRHLLKISPFGNTLCTVELSGRELWSALEVVNQNFISSGQHMYFSQGLKLTFENGQLKEIIHHDEIISKSSKQRFKISMNNFLAYGGGGFPDFRDHPTFKELALKDVDALEKYVKKYQTIKASDYKHGTYSPSCNELLLRVP